MNKHPWQDHKLATLLGVTILATACAIVPVFFICAERFAEALTRVIEALP